MKYDIIDISLFSWGLDVEDEDSDDEFFRETTDVLERGAKSDHLQPGFLQFRKMKDMNYCSHKEGAVISCTEFHPSSTVAMVAGNNGTVTLSQIDGKDNPKIQSINFTMILTTMLLYLDE